VTPWVFSSAEVVGQLDRLSIDYSRSSRNSTGPVDMRTTSTIDRMSGWDQPVSAGRDSFEN